MGSGVEVGGIGWVDKTSQWESIASPWGITVDWAECIMRQSNSYVFSPHLEDIFRVGSSESGISTSF